MPALIRIPRPADLDLERYIAKHFRRAKAPRSKALFEQGTQQAFEELGTEVLPSEASSSQKGPRAVPAQRIQERIRRIVEGNPTQQIGGGIGALGGGLLGAGGGALATRITKGGPKAKWGLLAGIPGAIAGHGLGTRSVKDRQLLTVLDEELGPGVGMKQAAVEVGFKEILDELMESKRQKTLDMPEFRGAIESLKAGRGRGLIPSERLLLRKHILDQPKPRPEDAPWMHKKVWDSKQSPGSRPKTPLQPKKFGKTPMAIAGGLAALAALGLGAATLWPRKKDEVLNR